MGKIQDSGRIKKNIKKYWKQKNMDNLIKMWVLLYVGLFYFVYSEGHWEKKN